MMWPGLRLSCFSDAPLRPLPAQSSSRSVKFPSTLSTFYQPHLSLPALSRSLSQPDTVYGHDVNRQHDKRSVIQSSERFAGDGT